MMNSTISFYTFGCRLNQSETAVIRRTFEADGFKIVDFKESADVVVVNTCTVTENGDTDTRRLINKINRINPNARIALVGCQAQIQKKELASLPNVRWVIGNAQKMDFVSILKEDHRPSIPRVITPTIEKKHFTVPVAGVDEKHTRANIKIQDGCDFFCSFCEIPYARGRARSRVFKDILMEAQVLVAAEHKELVLTGINIGTYGYNNKTMMDVLNALEQIEGLERIRISSIEPTTIPRELIEKWRKPTKICRHLHIPLQSASDEVLIKMKRKYTSEEFGTFIHEIADAVPEMCIGTDVIVGFPGESAMHFEHTLTCLANWPVHYFHVFSYSQRNMAKSQAMNDSVEPSVIAKRSRILRELSARKRQTFYKTLCGTIQKVLFEQKKKHAWTGLTDHYARVQVKSADNLENRYLNVKLEHSEGQYIIGSVNSHE